MKAILVWTKLTMPHPRVPLCPTVGTERLSKALQIPPGECLRLELTQP